MAYTPTTWSEAQTDLGPTNLNKLENGLQTAAATADAAIPKATVTAAGDLVVASGSGAVTRLAVGTANQLLHGGTTPAYSAVALADLSATGTPSASTYLRGDNSWAAISSAGAELDYAQITGDVSITHASEGTADVVITGNSISYAGSRVKVEAFIPHITSNGIAAVFVLLRDTTVLGQAESNSATINGGFKVEVFDTPSAAAHSYALKAFQSSGGTLTIKAGAGGTGALLPAFLRVTKA